MRDEEILTEFRSCQALLEGHFVLSSGLHSGQYLQCARVLMDPVRAARLASAIAANIPREIRSAINIVVSPAMGGLIIGHEMGRALGTEAIFLERPEGTFELRRGFALTPGQKVLMMEDVVTTGLSSREAIKAITEAGGDVIAAGALIDRSAGEIDLGVPFFPLLSLRFPSYAASDLPPELAAIPAGKAGQPETVMAARPAHEKLRLGVNIDHVATIRNARGGAHPDPVRAALIAADAGADGITAHLREDRRHIRDDDISALMERLTIPLNLEMAATDEMLAIALRHKPHAACIVPEKREERTTEGGLDAAGQHNRLADFVGAAERRQYPRKPVHRTHCTADRCRHSAWRTGGRVPYRPLCAHRGRGAHRRAQAHRRCRRAGGQERHRAACGPRADVRQCGAGRGDPAAA